MGGVGRQAPAPFQSRAPLDQVTNNGMIVVPGLIIRTSPASREGDTWGAATWGHGGAGLGSTWGDRGGARARTPELTGLLLPCFFKAWSQRASIVFGLETWGPLSWEAKQTRVFYKCSH